MDETTTSIIKKITQNFPLPQDIHSGHKVSVYYDCLSLTPNELARLAADALGDLKNDAFDLALGLAYRGINFANAVAGGREVGILQTDNQILGPSVKNKKIIIVDDVVHSGNKIIEAGKLVEKAGGEIVGYACIVDRSDGKHSNLSKPLWSAYQTVME
jgi:orotate phosphoribosyltransferase